MVVAFARSELPVVICSQVFHANIHFSIFSVRFLRGGGEMACYNYSPIGVRVDFGPVTIKQEVLSNFCRARILRLKAYTTKSTFSLSLCIFRC